MIIKRGFRWFLFFVAFVDFFVIVSGRGNLWTVCLFFIAGGGWYWLERRKMRELDALRSHKRNE